MAFSDFVWLLFGAPLEKCFYILYSLLYTVTSNYGISLLLLSVLTSCLMLPLEGKVKGLVEEERELQKVLAPQLKKINREYSGEQRHLAIKRLYKRYGYNPLFSIRSALSFFVQLPFLLGAYWMLTNLTSLDGVKFLFIKDLSKPDGLLFGCNLLPILMTVINIGTAFAQVSTRRDKIQAVFIAILFFVLLYSANSALLIYWTFNNFIGLCKALYVRFKLYFPNVVAKLSYFIPKEKNLFVLFVPFLSVALIVMSRSHLTPDKLKFFFAYGAHFINFALIFWLGYICFTKGVLEKIKRNSLYQFLCIVFCCLVLVTLFKIFGCLTGEEYKYVYSQSFVCIVPLILIAYWEQAKRKFLCLWEGLVPVNHFQVFFPFFFLLSLVFLTFPFLLYFSDTSAFLATPCDVVKEQIVGFIGCSIIFFLVISFLRGRSLTVLFILLSATAITVVMYLLVASPDLGSFVGFKFTQEAKVEERIGNFIYFGLFILAFILVVLCAKTNKIFVIVNVCIVFFITSLGYSLFTFLDYKNQETSPNTSKSSEDSERGSIPTSAQRFLTFSKDGKNILVIMLDSFSGYDMEKILKFDTSLKEKFEGFTLYTDTLTVGQNTIMSKAALMGGSRATPKELNAMAGESLEEKVNKLWDSFFSKLISLSYDINIWDTNYFIWLNTNFLSNLTKQHLLVNYENDFFIKDWEAANNYHGAVVKSSITNFLTAYGIFKISPNFVKKVIYQEGEWLALLDKASPEKIRAKNDISTLNSLSKFMTVAEGKQNSFKFYTNILPHFFWRLDSNCQPVDEYVPGPSELEKVPQWNARLQTEYCSLTSVIKLLTRLKKEGVYDNSSIVIVSDHGNHLGGDASPFEKPIDETLEHLNSLLLVKEFDAPKLPLVVDKKTLMRNSDVPLLILNQYSRENQSKPLLWKDKNRVREIFVGNWDRKKHGKSQFRIMDAYEVRGEGGNLLNWKKIEP